LYSTKNQENDESPQFIKIEDAVQKVCVVSCSSQKSKSIILILMILKGVDKKQGAWLFHS
jgi:hypothetical protein